MPVSNGLILGSGIAQGLQNGLNAFMEVSKAKRDEERQDRLDKNAQQGLILKAAEQGYDIDPQQGLILNDTGKRKRELDLQKEEAEIKSKNSMADWLTRRGKEMGGVSPAQFRADHQAHQATLRRLNGNTGLKQRLAQVQNIDNALGILDDADTITPQTVHEFQQAIRSNLGIKGNSGVDERSGTYLNSLGLNAANFMQFLTGDPASISKDDKIVKHIRNLANTERKNARTQYEKGLRAVAAGNASVYDRNPDLKMDLDDAISAYRDQLESVNRGPKTSLSPTQRAALIQSLSGGQ